MLFSELSAKIHIFSLKTEERRHFLANLYVRESHPPDFTEQNLSKEIVLTNKETISESLSSKMPQYPFFDFCVRKIYPFELFHPQISTSCARHFRTSERQVQGAAIYIDIAAPCTCKIHIENQPLTNLKKNQCNPRFCTPISILTVPPSKTTSIKKILYLFPVFSPNSYICTKLSEQSEETQRTPHRY